MKRFEDRRARAGAAEAGLRFDQALAQLLGVSRRKARLAIDLGGAWLNGRRCRMAGRRIRAGDELRLVTLEGEAPPPLSPAQIIWREGPLLALHKRAGQYAQPALHRSKDCLPEALSRLLDDGNDWQPAHRLDRGTSGVLLFCADKALRDRIQRAWGECARKRYLAVVAPAPDWDEREITLPIGKRRDAQGRYAPDPDGRPCRTRARVIRRKDGGGRALLELVPETGRSHQLRVHLSALGCPILGDGRYGGLPHQRMMLHAEFLALAPPALDAMREWRATPEEDWSW